MEIYLGNDIYFVEGTKNAAIYDLKNEKLYEINEMGKNAIINYENKKKLIKSEEQFIKKLVNIGLINPEQMNQNFSLPKPEYHIRFAWLELTNNCNLRCIHCYGKFGCENIDTSNELSKEKWFNVIDQLYNLQCRKVQLIGGEPLCSKSFIDILEYLNKKGFEEITIFTNATLINEKNVDILKKYNVNVKISLYGHNKEIHEKITKIKNSFQRTVEAIKLLKDNNVKVSVAIILMKENEEYLEKIKELIKDELDLKYNGFDVIRPSCINDNLEHRIHSYQLLSQRYYTYPRFKITKMQFYNNHYYNSCWNSKIAITSNGDIIPCIFARDFIIGNVKNGTIDEFKKKMLDQWKISKDYIEECKNCEFKYACSDCRPLAIGINGGKLSKYPRCCYFPNEGVWKKIEDVTKEIVE